MVTRLLAHTQEPNLPRTAGDGARSRRGLFVPSGQASLQGALSFRLKG